MEGRILKNQLPEQIKIPVEGKTYFRKPDGEIFYHFLSEDKGSNYGLIYLDTDLKQLEKFKALLLREPQRLIPFDGINAGSINDNWYLWSDSVRGLWWSLVNLDSAKLKKECAPKYQSWNWLTIAPRPMLDIEEDLDKFEEYIRSITIGAKMYFSEVAYVIESGKNEECPNLHAHILYSFKNTSIGKNYKRDACRRYDRLFKTEKGIDWFNKKGKGWYNDTFRGKDTAELGIIIQDKRDYCDNSKKSALHENYCDLGLNDSYKA